MQRTADAGAAFRRYLQEFPNGRQAATADFMRDQTEDLIARGEAPAAPSVPAIGKSISVRLEELGLVIVSSSANISLNGGEIAPVGRHVEVKRQAGSFMINGTRVTSPTVDVSSAGLLTVGSKPYRGKIRLYPAGGTQIAVIDQLPIEDYLAGVVTSGMPASFPPEALRAQAVAARTYAIYNIQHPRQPGVYDVYADPRSQEYQGIGGETAPGKRAVSETAGEVLMYQGRPILAYYDSNNGGKTADPAFVFDKAYPYLRASDDPYSRSEPLGAWTRSFSLQGIREALQASGYVVGAIQDIVPTLLCPSGRIVKLAVLHSAGRLELRTRTQFRAAINRNLTVRYKPENLPEILMALQKDTNAIRFEGGGWGHGVGLSQYGSRGRAHAGQTYRQILEAYDPGAILKKVY